MYNPQQKVCVVGSVNGLICLSIKDLVLWNPSMRLFRHLADSGLRVSGDCSVVYGFGYDDYKVVGVLFMHGFLILEDHVVVKICSRKSNSWSSMDDIPVVVRLTKPCKFVNGKLHWTGVLSWANNIYGGFHKDWNIVSIDLADEKPGEVEQPRYGEGGFCLNLEVLGSDLSVLCDILLVPRSTMMVRNPEDEPIRYPKVTNFGSCDAVNIYVESLVCATPFWNAQSKNKGC
ncbi:hypothetical protein BC332_15054 [Capsicum chinense]|nr:hypothetical protein BC332_15054 [Capsicum chinense]